MDPSYYDTWLQTADTDWILQCNDIYEAVGIDWSGSNLIGTDWIGRLVDPPINQPKSICVGDELISTDRRLVHVIGRFLPTLKPA